MSPTNTMALILVLSGGLSLSGCGGGSSSGDSGQTGNTVPNNNPNPNDPIPLLASGTSVDGQLDTDTFKIYQVPPGSQVVLRTTSGNSDLFLYSDPAVARDDLLCSSRRTFSEDSCVTDSSLSETYALVYGREASSYQLTTTNDCSVSAINEWVDRNMRDYYLFSEEVPTLNLQDYSSPESLISDLRFTSRDRFSSVRDAAVQASLFDEGNAFNFGYRWSRDNNGVARFSRVYRDSPMGRAGIERSDIIVSVNDVLWDNLSGDRFREFAGTADNPLPTTWIYIDSDTGETKSVQLTQAEYPVNSVTNFSMIPNSDYPGTIGYMAFETFLNTSAAEIDEAMAFFASEGITDLILDLRYNGGGRTFIARKLASHIGGPATDNQLLIEYQHNEKYESENFSRNFEAATPNLGLSRVVVLTTNSTASASEIVINSLKPYIEVITIGGTTQGKPYISSALTYCGKSLNAMHAEGVNRNGVGVFGGINADCAGTDDLTRDYGFSNDRGLEGFAQSATDYLVSGTCNASPTLTKLSTNNDLNSKQENDFTGADGS